MDRRVAIDQPLREKGAPSTHNHHRPDTVAHLERVRPRTWEWTNLLGMQNFAGEMHHHKMRHLSSTLLDRDQGLELIVTFAACWRKASWRCTPSPEIPAAACHVGTGSQRATQLILHRALIISRQWAGELPSTSRSGKGEHRRHIITTGQTLSVSTSKFSLHLQLECSTKSLSTS